jgi:hypothetical protein
VESPTTTGVAPAISTSATAAKTANDVWQSAIVETLGDSIAHGRAE